MAELGQVEAGCTGDRGEFNWSGSKHCKKEWVPVVIRVGTKMCW